MQLFAQVVALKKTEYSSYFNWFWFLISLPIFLVLTLIIEWIFDLSVFMSVSLLIVLIVISFMLAKNNKREHNTWHRR